MLKEDIYVSPIEGTATPNTRLRKIAYDHGDGRYDIPLTGYRVEVIPGEWITDDEETHYGIKMKVLHPESERNVPPELALILTEFDFKLNNHQSQH